MLGAVVSVPIALALPNYHPAQTHAGTGSAPDRRRYRLAIVTTALAVCGFFCIYTYISPFLTKVAGLALHDLAAVLLVTGASMVGGVFAGLSCPVGDQELRPSSPWPCRRRLRSPSMSQVEFSQRRSRSPRLPVPLSALTMSATKTTYLRLPGEHGHRFGVGLRFVQRRHCRGFPCRRLHPHEVRATANGPPRRVNDPGGSLSGQCPDPPAEGPGVWGSPQRGLMILSRKMCQTRYASPARPFVGLAQGP